MSEAVRRGSGTAASESAFMIPQTAEIESMPERDKPEESERGKRASFDPQTGEVHGSGSGAGGNGNPNEDHDSDPMGGSGRTPVGGPRPIEESVNRPIDPDEGA